MTPAPPLPDHLWNSASPELQAAILALVQISQQQIAALEARVNDLEARLKLNSTNSSKPPSSDPIGLKRNPPTPPTRPHAPLARSHRFEPQAPGPSQSEEAGRTSRPSQGVPPLGPPREGP